MGANTVLEVLKPPFFHEIEIVLEYFRSLQKKRRIDKVRREEKLEVKGNKRVSPRVIRQMSGSELLKFVAERWVFIPRLVTWASMSIMQPIGISR